MKGTVTHIQRMSIHDGPGIRSTVFMKGCNLRCRWCHNPETWSAGKQLQYIESKCTGCRTCIRTCPQEVFTESGGRLEISRRKCTLCGKCIQGCRGEALSVVGMDMSAGELFEAINEDRIFYETSGGGVTFSGGEPLLQADFVGEVLGMCRKSGIHTAVESNLNAGWDKVEQLASSTDLWMCDFKIHDSAKHREWTGCGNGLIADNIKRLAATGADLIVRTPVIPGVNDSAEEIGFICEFLSRLGGHVRYELLGFHSLGFCKFENLGMDNPLPSMKDLPQEKLESLKNIVETYKLN